MCRSTISDHRDRCVLIHICFSSEHLIQDPLPSDFLCMLAARRIKRIGSLVAEHRWPLPKIMMFSIPCYGFFRPTLGTISTPSYS